MSPSLLTRAVAASDAARDAERLAYQRGWNEAVEAAAQAARDTTIGCLYGNPSPRAINAVQVQVEACVDAIRALAKEERPMPDPERISDERLAELTQPVISMRNLYPAGIRSMARELQSLRQRPGREEVRWKLLEFFGLGGAYRDASREGVSTRMKVAEDQFVVKAKALLYALGYGEGGA